MFPVKPPTLSDPVGPPVLMDGDGWLTKAEAAKVLGVKGRTVERLAARGALTSRTRPGFPTVYNPSDVARAAAQGRTVHRAAILAADGEVGSNGHGAAALVPLAEAPLEPVESALVWVLDLLAQRLGIGPTEGPTGPTPPTVFVGLAEASALSGLSPSCLRKLIAEQKLNAVKDRGWKIRRRDLEQL